MDTWHTIGLSFSESVVSDSQATITKKNFRVYLDGQVAEFIQNQNFTYGTLITTIGRIQSEIQGGGNLGFYTNYYPLHGQIEMLATRTAFCELSTLNILSNELKGITKVNQYDELGMLKKIELHESGTSILSNTINYKTRSDSKYLSKQVKSEEFKMKKSSSLTRSYETDALGNITKITDNIFGSHNYQYDNRGFLIEDKELLTKYDYYKTRVSKQTLHNQDSITYSYDSMNNITSKTTLENGVQLKVQYAYDKLGRLKTETRNDEVERFTYYHNGNIRYREVVRNNTVIIKEEYQYDTVIKDRLLRIKDLISNSIVQDITYDSRFVFNPKQMMIDGVSKTLTWEGRRLTGITGSTYQYNSEGIRTKKIKPNETTTFDLEGSNIISMNKITSTENVRLDFVYDASATLIGVNTTEGHYFYIRDITGNILGLIDNESKYIVKYKYDAWGNCTELDKNPNDPFASINPIRYRSYYLDLETGYYYLHNRYYDPEIGAFISPDSTEYLDPESIGGLNLYAYCLNGVLTS